SLNTSEMDRLPSSTLSGLVSLNSCVSAANNVASRRSLVCWANATCSSEGGLWPPPATAVSVSPVPSPRTAMSPTTRGPRVTSLRECIALLLLCRLILGFMNPRMTVETWDLRSRPRPGPSRGPQLHSHRGPSDSNLRGGPLRRQVDVGAAWSEERPP